MCTNIKQSHYVLEIYNFASYEGEMKMFSDKQNLREFIASPVLKQVTENIIKYI